MFSENGCKNYNFKLSYTGRSAAVMVCEWRTYVKMIITITYGKRERREREKGSKGCHTFYLCHCITKSFYYTTIMVNTYLMHRLSISAKKDMKMNDGDVK